MFPRIGALKPRFNQAHEPGAHPTIRGVESLAHVLDVAERLDERHLGHGLPRPSRMGDVLRKARRWPFETRPDVIQGYHRVRRSRRLGQ